MDNKVKEIGDIQVQKKKKTLTIAFYIILLLIFFSIIRVLYHIFIRNSPQNLFNKWLLIIMNFKLIIIKNSYFAI